MNGDRERDPKGGDLERRLAEARRQLRRHHAGVEPDAGFALRVAARLPRRDSWTLGWAALRILPASVALAIALLVVALVGGGGTFGLSSAPAATVAYATAEDDGVALLLEAGERTR